LSERIPCCREALADSRLGMNSLRRPIVNRAPDRLQIRGDARLCAPGVFWQ
jgi:hypothetical protein